MSTFNVNVVHIHNSQTVPIRTPKSPQHAGDSSSAGATESGVASQATLSLNYTPRPWTQTLSLVGPTPRDLLEIYYARFPNHNTDVRNATPIVDSIRTSGSVAKDPESVIVDHLVMDSLASGTVDPAVLIRTLPHSREKRSQGVMRSQAAGVHSDRHHPYNMANRPSRAGVPTNSGNEHANAFCRPSGETENTQMYTSQHRELHHGDGSGYNIPVEQMPRPAPSPNEDGRESEMRGSAGDGNSGESEQQPRKMQGHRSDYDTCFRSREEICSQGKAGVGKRKRRKL